MVQNDVNSREDLEAAGYMYGVYVVSSTGEDPNQGPTPLILAAQGGHTG